MLRNWALSTIFLIFSTGALSLAAESESLGGECDKKTEAAALLSKLAALAEAKPHPLPGVKTFFEKLAKLVPAMDPEQVNELMERVAEIYVFCEVPYERRFELNKIAQAVLSRGPNDFATRLQKAIVQMGSVNAGESLNLFTAVLMKRGEPLRVPLLRLPGEARLAQRVRSYYGAWDRDFMKRLTEDARRALAQDDKMEEHILEWQKYFNQLESPVPTRIEEMPEDIAERVRTLRLQRTRKRLSQAYIDELDVYDFPWRQRP